MDPILLACDLDRTVLPNGAQPESSQARELFAKLVAAPEVALAYVSGRTKSLLQEAIAEYDLPIPAYAIGDVGTTIYEVGPSQSWKPLQAWQDMIAVDWAGYTWDTMKPLFDNVEEIWLQDDNPAFQNTFKVSYYTDPTITRDDLIEKLEHITKPLGISAAFIWSVDEQRNVGLLDVLPKSATKLHAIEFLQSKHLDFPKERLVFAGDSGNDLLALTSSYKSIVVANAPEEVKEEAKSVSAQKGVEDTLYIAEGGFMGMNGNYTAGVLEGVAHFIPEASEILL